MLVSKKKTALETYARIALIPIVVAPLCTLAFAQAHITENQTTLLYVSPLGSDSNPGTQNQPYLTIGKAMSRAQSYASKGVGVKVEIEPGTYRETVNIYHEGSDPTLTVEAVKPGTAVLSGSDVYTGWQRNGNYYEHSFPGLGPNPLPKGWPAIQEPIFFRREQVFVNGQPMTQVLNESELVPGTFYVDDNAHQIELRPLAGVDPSAALVEVSTRPSLLTVYNRSNVVLRGLTIQHGAPIMNRTALTIYGGSNLLLDHITADWNVWGGIGINHSVDVTLQNSVADYNGAIGALLSYNKNMLIQYDEAGYNNWRGEAAAFYDWAMGGFKFFADHGATLKHVSMLNNSAEGLWFDTDNRDISVTNADLVGNYDTNLQIELNYGPISVSNSYSCFGTTGLNLINSSQVTLSGNVFFGNGQNSGLMKPQFALFGRPGGRHFTDWETGAYHNVISSNITVEGNDFEDASNPQAPRQLFYTYLSGSDWSKFQTTLSANSNHYHDALVPASFYVTGRAVDFSEWRSKTGQDSNSEWAPTTLQSACAAPSPAFADFALYAATTQEQASYSARNGVATIPLHVKNFGTGAAVQLSVSVPGASATLSASQVANARENGYAGADVLLTVKADEGSGRRTVRILATSGNRVHTVEFPVSF